MTNPIKTTAKNRIFRSFSGLAAATFLSRVLGLVREMLTARIIGGGSLMTAWGLAFTVANLFRRMFGEGTAGTAIVPMLSHSIAGGGRETARRQLTVILGALSLILVVLCMAVAIVSFPLSFWIREERWRLAFEILPVVIPYALFICLTGVIASVLGCIGSFARPAMYGLSLNIFLIVALLCVSPDLAENPFRLLLVLSVSVVLSGIVQLVLTFRLLARENLAPLFPVDRALASRTLADFWNLFLPGIVGTSALQFSLLVDRTLASLISEYAVPALIYSDRIVYLPIGVFAVSVGSVALSDMSRSAARNDPGTMLESLSFCLRQLLFLCIPCAVFAVVFRYDLVKLFYEGGRFGEREVEETAYALGVYAMGIPAFAVIKVTVASFYSRKMMRIPVRASLVCIGMNIVLNLILMWPLKQAGIALATVIASYANNGYLLWKVRQEFPDFESGTTKTIGKTLAAALLSVCLVVCLEMQFFEYFPATSKFAQILRLSFFCGIFGILHILLCYAMKTGEITEIVQSLTMRFKRKRASDE